MVQTVAVRLDEPPEPVAIGVGVHGTDGQVDDFLLPDLWQFHLYDYTADLTVGGTGHVLRPGSVSLVPPGTPVRYRYRGRSEHLYVHLRLGAGGDPRDVLAVQHAGAQAAVLDGQVRQALAGWPQTRGGAVAEGWAALWRVAGLAPPQGRGARVPHPAVAAAVALIEQRLAQPLAVSEIAKEAGVSHNHLTRLFRTATGQTVVAYVRARRMERARHLLRASTLSIPAIAATVGIPDLQAFNKACRRELGASPRTIRGA
ncbi:helix-turn-helix transcriptional regulator [Streptomyces sp. N35]|uniref:helix-turn-helix transcriptional regulator n=1 Tax=Streptomyces sp. N35 TaxID=2795730 RepID=UPI0018F7B09E|nr:helix-turn-helix transcriptional regulator [Streptomyces sp. N35]